MVYWPIYQRYSKKWRNKEALYRSSNDSVLIVRSVELAGSTKKRFGYKEWKLNKWQTLILCSCSHTVNVFNKTFLKIICISLIPFTSIDRMRFECVSWFECERYVIPFPYQILYVMLQIWHFLLPKNTWGGRCR